MANRPKKELTEAQWKDILQKHIVEQISARKLAKEYEVPESTIRTRAKSAQSAQINTVAHQIVSVSENLRELNNYAQTLTLRLSARLCNISNDLAEMGELGVGTGKTLFAIAASQKLKINTDDPMESQEVLQAIGALTELGNKSAVIGREMLNNNKAIIERMNGSANQGDQSGPAITLTDAELDRIISG